MPTITLLITLCFSFLVPFSFLNFLFSLLSFTHFLTSFSLVFISLVLCSPLFSLLCTAKTLFILPTVTDFLLFYPLTAFVLVWVSYQDYSLVSRLPIYHHLPMLAVPHPIPRQKSFVLFSYSLWHSHPDKGGHSLLLSLMAYT